MSTISNTMNSYAENVAVYNTSKKDKQSKTEEKMEIESTESTKKVQVSGRTIGNPELSEKGAKYYEELKRKYSNMDFILVSKEQKEFAKANASKYGNANKMVVLIDEEKIERMAEDENYRKQYESVIANAASGLTQLKKSLAQKGMNVKSCGIKVNDNGAASFFATMDKNFKAQNKRIEKKRAEKKAAKKAEQKKQEKKAQDKKAQEKKAQDKVEKEKLEDDEEITFEASSIDELLRKIENMDYVERSEGIMSEAEKKIGQQFDFSI